MQTLRLPHSAAVSVKTGHIITGIAEVVPPLPLLVFLAPLLLFLGVLQTQRILAGSAAICWQRRGLLAATAAFRRTESVRVPAGDGDGDGGEGRPEGLEGWAGHHCDVVAGERSR